MPPHQPPGSVPVAALTRSDAVDAEATGARRSETIGATTRAVAAGSLVVRCRSIARLVLGELEEIVERVQVVVGAGVAGQGAEAGDRAVEELVGGGVEHDGEGVAVGGGEVPQLAVEAPGELGLEHGPGAGAERDDGGGERLLLRPGLEAARLLVGDGGGAGGLRGAALERLADDLGEGIDVVQVHVVELVDARVDVAGDGDVDEEEAPALAGLARALDQIVRDHVAGARRRRDDDVGLDQRPLQIAEGARLAADVAGERRGALGAAVDDEQARARADEQLGGGLGHLAGADERRGVAVEIAEDVAGQIDGDARHRDLALADGRLGAHPLAHAHGAVHGVAQDGAQRAVLAGDLDGVLELAEDLRLAHHQRVERGRHAEEVPHGGLPHHVEQVRQDGLAAEILEHRQGGAGRGPELDVGAATAARGGVDLDPVAGGEDDRPAHGAVGGEPREDVRHHGARDGQPLAHLEGRVLVGEADDDDHRRRASARISCAAEAGRSPGSVGVPRVGGGAHQVDDEDGGRAAEAQDGAVRRAPAPPPRRGAEEEHPADEEPRRVAEDGAHHLLGAAGLELLGPVGAGDDAQGEQGEAGHQEAVLGGVERVERGQVADARGAPLLEAPLLHQVERRRAAREEEERHAEEVGDHVEGDEQRREPRLRRRLAEEVGAEEERQTERAHQQPERVDAEAGAEREVGRRREERGHREEEVDGVNRTDVGDEAGEGDVRGVPQRRRREELGRPTRAHGPRRGRRRRRRLRRAGAGGPPRRAPRHVEIEEHARAAVEEHGHRERQGRDQSWHGRLR